MDQVGTTDVVGPDYTSLFQFESGGQTYLIGYNRRRSALDAYQIIEGPPWITRAMSHPKVGSGFDSIEPFVIGNRPHLACYTSESGLFKLFSFGDGLSVSEPYEYYRTREPAPTVGFTTVKSFTCFGQVLLLGYDIDDGRVAMYKVSVTATSPPAIPPLRISHVWAHQWSKGWTRFAFFQFGGETFFLKTNVVHQNVNIDHVLDDLSGTAEVGTHLDLWHAKQLHTVQPFSMENGDPYFVTYERTGEITLNRFHGNCLGWSRAGTYKSIEGATHVVPTRAKGRLLLLVA
jgi:hypothetical protein